MKTIVFTGNRKQFEDAVKKVFGTGTKFFEFIENGEYSNLYDVFYSADDECYIINRETGKYVNWYKFTHIGRDIHSTIHPNDFVQFLKEFKSSGLERVIYYHLAKERQRDLKGGQIE